jgi:polyisoprenoid-binding protein YceI
MLRASLGIVLALCAASVSARDWQTDAAASTLGFSGVYQKEKFDGKFKKFTAKISYDAADLAKSSFDVDIDIASVDTQNEERDAALPDEEFFATKKFPKAHFVTKAFRKAVDGSVEADGTLTVRDKSKPVTLKVKMAETGDKATLDVDTTVNRLDYNVGTGDWKDTTLIGNEVKVHGHLVLSAKAGG